MRKMRHKVRNGQNLPHESPNFTNYYFQSDFTYNFSHFSTSLRPHYQNSFFLNIFFCFIFLTQGCLKTCAFGVTKCVIPKQASVQLLHGPMNLDLTDSIHGI
jgi:hypothetical protein